MASLSWVEAYPEGNIYSRRPLLQGADTCGFLWCRCTSSQSPPPYGHRKIFKMLNIPSLRKLSNVTQFSFKTCCICFFASLFPWRCQWAQHPFSTIFNLKWRLRSDSAAVSPRTFAVWFVSLGLDVHFILLEKTLQTLQLGSTSCLEFSFTSFSIDLSPSETVYSVVHRGFLSGSICWVCIDSVGLVQKRSRKVLTSRISVCCWCGTLPLF